MQLVVMLSAQRQHKEIMCFGSHSALPVTNQMMRIVGWHTPALRGNEVSMDTIDLGNSESLVCGVFPNQDGTFTAMTYTKSKTFKTENGARRWLERNSGE